VRGEHGSVSIVVDGFLLVTGARTVKARARAVVDLPSEPPPTQLVRTTRRF
jgi:hypothetical protein